MMEVAKAAHTLKSSSANVGALELSDRCKQLESAAKRGAAETARDLLSEVESGYRLVETALVSEREPRATEAAGRAH